MQRPKSWIVNYIQRPTVIHILILDKLLLKGCYIRDVLSLSKQSERKIFYTIHA